MSSAVQQLEAAPSRKRTVNPLLGATLDASLDDLALEGPENGETKHGCGASMSRGMPAPAAPRTGHVGRPVAGKHLLLHHFQHIVERDAEADVGDDLEAGSRGE